VSPKPRRGSLGGGGLDMERTEVIAVLDSLAAAGSQPAEVIAALSAASTLLREPSRPTARFTRWTDEEDAQLCREFDDGLPMPDIAKAHGRTRAAIELRLVKLGRLDEESVKVRRRA
jgi:hypothetical protein